MELRISVRTLVEFLLRSGDLDNRAAAAPEKAMLEGSRMHRQLQKAAGGDYRAEVPLRMLYVLESDDDDAEPIEVILEGRADGIYEGQILEEGENCTVLPDLESGMALSFVNPDYAEETALTIDEIKTTYHRLSRMKEPDRVHLAQARCYAYMAACDQQEEVMHVRMTYCNLATQELRYFYERITYEELKNWFDGLMQEYEKWARFQLEWKKTCVESIRALHFPYPYREGQRELTAAVYQTIVQGKKLFLEAPTGTGKTLATLYPSLKAIGEGRAEKLFYLTAKTITRTVAEDAMNLLREHGLRCKNTVITAKDKICILEKPDCNPESCPRAGGHYDRINEAMYELLTETDNFNRETILACAEKYSVCPFELSLDMSLFSDTILCDYNYVFDPHAYLRRFFAGGEGREPYLFLVDEAHNLVERGRDMYSARLSREQVLAVRRQVKDAYPKLGKKLMSLGRAFLPWKKQMQLSGEEAIMLSIEELEELLDAAGAAGEEIVQLLDRQRIADLIGQKRKKPEEDELREALLEFYFELSHFLLMSDGLDDHYRIYVRREGKEHILTLFCVDPSRCLKSCMDRGTASILFSATFLPIQYYKSLLGGTQEDYEIYAQSVFNPEKKGLFILDDVSSLYKRRTPEEYERMAASIYEITRQRHGNYLVYCPSHAFLRRIVEAFSAIDPFGQIERVVQSEHMSEAEREAFLSCFEEIREDHALIGFCVLGGVFSEGIDLKNDSLIGVMVIGTGLPQVCYERELLKDYFDGRGENGFDYAYRYPGMNKVLQAAGRVIRTADDVGIVALLDDRFLTLSYKKLFPREWTDYEEVSAATVGTRVERFWNEWL